MSKFNLIYKLNGDFVEGINFFDLMECVHSLTEVIRISNQELKLIEGKINFNIKPIEKGSIIIDLLVYPESLFGQAQCLFGINTPQIKELMKIIGLINPAENLDVMEKVASLATSGKEFNTSVLALIIWLKNRKITKYK